MTVPRSTPFLPAAVVAIAAGLRLWGVGYELPYLHHPDEPRYVAISQNIFKTGDPNPHFFNYPSLFFYVHALGDAAFFAVARVTGAMSTPADMAAPVMITMGDGVSPAPSTILLGRVITILFGVATVLVVFMIGRRVCGAAAGLLAALMLAVSPLAVAHSRFITPDTVVTFFAAATLLAAVGVQRHGGMWRSITAGLLAGLTASTKHNGALVLLPVLVAHIAGPRGQRPVRRRIALAVACCAAGFLVATPFAILDPRAFLSGVHFEARHYATGHPGMEGHAFAWYLELMWRSGGLLYVFAGCELVRGILVRSRDVLLVASFPVAYFALIGGLTVRNDRTLLPLTPFLFLLSGSFLAWTIAWIRARPSGGTRVLASSAALTVVAAALALPAVHTTADTLRLTAVTSRAIARNWIAAHLPPGSKIAVESYAPFVDPGAFRVTGCQRLIDYAPDWYAENDFDYLVASEAMFGRFRADPRRYARENAAYDSCFARYPLLRRFDGEGDEVRIHVVRPNADGAAIPSVETPARVR